MKIGWVVAHHIARSGWRTTSWIRTFVLGQSLPACGVAIITTVFERSLRRMQWGVCLRMLVVGATFILRLRPTTYVGGRRWMVAGSFVVMADCAEDSERYGTSCIGCLPVLHDVVNCGVCIEQGDNIGAT